MSLSFVLNRLCFNKILFLCPMNINKLIYRLFTSAVLISIFASCNSSNKVVSSFGKRKYTKGFYLNLPSRTTTITKKAT